MLKFESTPATMHKTVLIFKDERRSDNVERSTSFYTGAIKPKARGPNNDNMGDSAFVIFDPINHLFSMLPTETQEKIFDIYEDLNEEIIRPTNISIMSVSKNINYLAEKVESLMNILTYDMLMLELERNKQIVIPILESDQYSRSVVPRPYSGVGLQSESFDGVRDSASYSEYRTEDYKGLIVLSLAARCLIPIFCNMNEYMDEGISPKFRNYVSFRVIHKSWLQESEVMNKFRHYIDYQVRENKRSKDSAVLEGIVSTNLPEYIASDAFIKKLGVFDLYQEDQQRHNLIKAVYNHTTSGVLEAIDRKFVGAISKKAAPKERNAFNNGEEDRTGVLEDNFTRNDISIGTRVLEDTSVMELDNKRAMEILLRRPPTTEEMKIQRELRSCISAMDTDSHTGRFMDYVTATICEDITPASMLFCLKAKTALKIQSLAMTKLIIHGHYDIVALCMSVADEEMLEWKGSNPLRTSKDLQQEMYLLFNVWYAKESAKRSHSFRDFYVEAGSPAVQKDQRNHNPGTRQIKMWMDNLLIRSCYKSSLPQQYLELCEGYDPNGSSYNYQRPDNINNLLAKFIIQIAKENQLTEQEGK